jgi:HSP20 family protein
MSTTVSMPHSKPRWVAGMPRSLGSVQREMDQLFDHFFGPTNGGSAVAARWFAPAAMWEEEGKFHVELELPGVKSEDLDITFEDQTLSIKAIRNPANAERKYWHNERAFGEVTRTVNLPDTVDPDSIEAHLADGVLHLSIAKRPETQPKKISVKVA